MKYLLSILMISVSLLAFNQQGDGGRPRGQEIIHQAQVLAKIPIVYFAEPNIQKLQSEDRTNDSLHIGPWRFGYNYDTDINLYDQATWIPTKEGGKVGLLKISAKNAKTINLTFSNTRIPEGNALYIYNPDKTVILGKFTQHHIYKGELGAELIPGHTVIVEYDVSPENIDNMGNVEISRVTYGYRTSKEFKMKVFGSSQSCEMNVNCPDGAPYIQQRNSAVMLVVGSNGFCSGALINNTAYDGKPYVLTANHCTLMHDNYASWIFRFKWQSPTCSSPSSSPSYESLSGAALLAKRDPSDFCLVKITGGLDSGKVPQNCSPYFAGWNRGNVAPPSTFCIHHPKGDIAKISFDDNPPVISQGMGSSEANSTWKVTWDRHTATESGSSGSPLFNNAGQIIGELWGGNSNCSNSGAGGYDYYGRLHNSWNPLGSNTTNQLRYWLDPNNSGDTSITGYDPYVTPANYNAAAINIKGLDGAACQTLFYPKAIIQNRGSNVLTSLTIHYTYNSESVKTIHWTGNLTTYQTAAVQLPPITNIQGENQVEIQVEKPNGQPDAITSDNLFSVNYHAAPSGSTLDFTFYMGCFSSENSWLLKNDTGDTLYAGSGSINESDANHYVRDTFCLKDGCYDLVLKDSYGDGVFGSAYPNCDYDGSMTLINDESRDTLAELPVSEANFGYEKVYHFCLTSAQVFPATNDLLVYPNPSNGKFMIVTALKGTKKVQLFSVMGQKVIDFQTEDQHFTINDNHQLAAGIYFLRVGNGAHEIVRKIFVR